MRCPKLSCLQNMAVVVQAVLGAPPILEPILVAIESDVHWGYVAT